MSERRRAVVGLVALTTTFAAVTVTWSPPASATYSVVHDLSDAGQQALLPQVAVAPDGAATTVWMRYDGQHYRIQARRLSSEGTRGPLRTLSGAGQDADQPHVAVDAAGVATVVWMRWDGTQHRIQTRRMLPDGSLSLVRTLSAVGQSAHGPKVALDDAGVATVAWSRWDGTHHRVQARRLAADGVPVTGPLTLSEAGFDAYDVELAVDPAGHATVVWCPYVSGGSRVRALRWPAAGLPGPVTLVSPEGRNALAPQVDVAPDGAATVAYNVSDGVRYRVSATRLPVSGAPTTWTLSAAGEHAWEPQVGVDGHGHATVVWRRWDGADYRVQSRRIQASGQLLGVRAVSPAAETTYQPQVGVDAAGDAHVVWVQEEIGSAPDRIRSRTVPVSGALTPLQYLSTIRDATTPQVAAGENGASAAVFGQYDGAHMIVVGALDPG